MITDNQAVFRYYREQFLPIYADLVAMRGEKFNAINNEIANAFSHLASANSKDTFDQVNAEKALNHLQQGTLDAAKLLWLIQHERASELFRNGELRDTSSSNLGLVWSWFAVFNLYSKIQTLSTGR